MTQEIQTLILLGGMMSCAVFVVGCLTSGVFGVFEGLGGFLGFCGALVLVMATKTATISMNKGRTSQKE